MVQMHRSWTMMITRVERAFLRATSRYEQQKSLQENNLKAAQEHESVMMVVLRT